MVNSCKRVPHGPLRAPPWWKRGNILGWGLLGKRFNSFRQDPSCLVLILLVAQGKEEQPPGREDDRVANICLLLLCTQCFSAHFVMSRGPRGTQAREG